MEDKGSGVEGRRTKLKWFKGVKKAGKGVDGGRKGRRGLERGIKW